jgi:hypothetical protein
VADAIHDIKGRATAWSESAKEGNYGRSAGVHKTMDDIDPTDAYAAEFVSLIGPLLCAGDLFSFN